MKYYYTYKVTLPETGEYYIGRRTCEAHPDDDPYKGSMTRWKVDKNKLSKVILGIYDTPKQLEEAEIWLIERNIKDPLNRNAHIPKVGFYIKKHTEESKNKMRILGKNKGIKRSEEFKKKVSERMKGNKIHSGKHWFTDGINDFHKFEQPEGTSPGRTHKNLKSGTQDKTWYTDGIKNYSVFPGQEPEGTWKGFTKKNLYNALGMRHYNNGTINKRFIEGTEPEGWIPGRIFKKDAYSCLSSLKWYTNGIKIIHVIPGTQPEGFVPGKKLK